MLFVVRDKMKIARMRMSLTALKKELENILTSAGFDAEQYYIKMHDDHVSVHFDVKEAVEYFKGDFDDAVIAKECIFEYRKEGKTHAACVYPW
jgi:hypothetical protein